MQDEYLLGWCCDVHVILVSLNAAAAVATAAVTATVFATAAAA